MSESGNGMSEMPTIFEKKFAKRPRVANLVSLFSPVKSGPRRELGTQQTRQIIRTSFGVQSVYDANIRVKDLFYYFIVEQNRSFSYMIGGAYVQLLVFKV